MNLINKKLIQQKYANYEFPTGNKLQEINILIDRWQRALKDSDLENTKEKSIQGKFLQTFFENILGYDDVASGNVEYTLIQHPRIENNVGEPDGSLGFFTKGIKDTRVVIELKDAKTDLDKKQNREVKQTPIDQAYNYASKEDKCKWIIVSNFKEIRLYSKARSQEYYEKFLILDLLNEQEFKKFYFLLTKDNLINRDGESVIDVLANESTQQEQDITNDYYAKYKDVRLGLLNHLIDNNPEIPPEKLLEKTQKLIDRIVFTLFCEDTTELLPYEIVKKTYERALNSFANSDQRVWNEFKGLFKSIDEGNSRVTPPINAYNGGLFKYDEILDNLVILDDFWKEILELADYDYQTDINVNILGHIFEQSISDLEKIKESVLLATEGGDILTTEDGIPLSVGDKSVLKEKKGRRKKDGIFYTPEFITKYIVENTVGRYLEENPDRLSNIKILDPACGSGAFLNQAHSYLQKEYARRFDEKLQEIRDSGKQNLNLYEDFDPASVNKGILLDNLFGVDLNKESVEITKLALWLKTARKTEPLQNLDKNIKCGNSLIDDPDVVGEKAFAWNAEYKEVLQDGGFDVIIANPPYVNIANIENDKERKYLQDNYSTVQNKSDLYSIFTEKAVQLLKDDGLLGFIFSNSWMGTQSFEKFRKYLLENLEILQLVKLPEKVFSDATVKTVILIAKKRKVNNAEIELVENVNFLFQRMRNSISYSSINEHPAKTFSFERIIKLNGESVLGNEVKFSLGIKTSNDKKFILEYKKDAETYPMVRGRNIQRYVYSYDNEYIWYKPELMKEKVGSGPRHLDYFKVDSKVLIQDVAQKIISCVDRDKILTNDTVTIIYDTGKFSSETIVALLNSKVINNWFKGTYPSGLHIKINQLETIPIPNSLIHYNDQLTQLVKEIEEKIRKYDEDKIKFLQFLEDSYAFKFTENEKKDFTNLGWNILMEKYPKTISSLSIDKREELHIWFKKNVKEIVLQSNEISRVQKTIDNILYDVYNISIIDRDYLDSL